jgi:ribosomal protein S18 acetylase RimI-like enzyme
VADDLMDLPEGIDLQPSEPGDRSSLLAVYESTRTEELAAVPWSEDEKAAFIASQFEAQDTYYRQTYPSADFLVVLADGRRIGRLYLTRIDDELRVIDIALLPDHRGRGIGSSLLASIIALAEREGLAVTLHVEPWNPAKRLYERLGFVSEGLRGIYEFMRRPASTPGQLKTAS